MFILLTFFFGLGFVSRAAWAWSARPGFLAAQLDRLLLLAVCLIGVGGVIHLLSGPLLRDTFAMPAAVLLAIAAMIVGGALRDLLAREAVSDAAVTQNRNHGIALAAAGLAVIFAAIEHDHAILARLTKFSAGNVSAEFAASGSQPRPVRSFDFNQPAGPAQSGRTRSVDYVTQRLEGFERWIETDQNLIRLFARRPAGATPIDHRAAAEMGAFAVSIADLGRRLNVLQLYFRSETAPLGVDPALISDLRDFYELHLNFPGGQCPAPDAAPSPPETEPPDAPATSCRLLLATQLRLAARLEELDCRVQIELFATGKDQGFRTCLPDKPGRYLAPSPLLAGFPRGPGWHAPYLDYLAFLLALTEVAAGHTESAIATLDRQLQRIVAKTAPLAPGPQQSEGDLAPVVSRVLYLRLGVIQTDLLGFVSGINSSEAMLQRAVTWLQVFDDLLNSIDRDRQLRDTTVLKSPTDGEPAKCAFLSHQDWRPLGRALFGIAAMKNNLAYNFSQRPGFFAVRQFRIATIDKFIDDIMRLDFRCFEQSGAIPSAAAAEAAFKHTVGQYLLVRDAELTKTSRLNEKRLSAADQLDALCKARTAFGQALDAWARVGIKDAVGQGWQRLDVLLGHSIQIGLKQSIQEQQELVEQALRDRHKSQCLA